MNRKKKPIKKGRKKQKTNNKEKKTPINKRPY